MNEVMAESRLTAALPGPKGAKDEIDDPEEPVGAAPLGPAGILPPHEHHEQARRDAHQTTMDTGTRDTCLLV